MRDYPNGGFFFIDAEPIVAAGEDGLKIDGIFEDAKRAIEGGKVFVMTNYAPVADAAPFSGIVLLGTGGASNIQVGAYLGTGNIVVTITVDDLVTIEMTE